MKVLCPDGTEKTVEEVLDSDYFPKPILKALLDGRTKKKKKKTGHPRFGVTRLVGDCLRKSYYDLTEEVPISLEQLWIFSRGHAIHNFFQAHLDESEQEIFLEKPFHHFSVIGFVDALHDNTLFEYKTTSNIPNQPKRAHVLQSQAYFSMLPEEEQKKIKKLEVIYFSLSRIKQYEVPKRNILPYLEARGTILAQSLESGNPPKREEGWICNYCEFSKICRPKLLFPKEYENGSSEPTLTNANGSAKPSQTTLNS